jgi:hypothetical protein
VLVLDPVVVTDAEEPVAYEESHGGTPSPPTGRKRCPTVRPAQHRRPGRLGENKSRTDGTLDA